MGVLNYFGLNDHSMGKRILKKEVDGIKLHLWFLILQYLKGHTVFETATSNQKLRMKTVSCWSCAYSKLHLPKGGQSNLAFDLAKAAALLLKCRIKLRFY